MTAAETAKTAKKAKDAIETTLDVTEEVLDGVVDVSAETLTVVRNNPALLIAAGVVGLLAGGAGGYFFAKKKLKAHYEQVANDEISDAHDQFRKLYKVGDYATPGDAMAARGVSLPEEAQRALEYYQGRAGARPDENGNEFLSQADTANDQPLVPEYVNAAKDIAEEPSAVVKEESVETTVDAEAKTVEVERKTRTIFSGKLTDFDFDLELPLRSRESPYVITDEEFTDGVTGVEQDVLTYYKGDDVLADRNDIPVDDVEYSVGQENLEKFGYGSGDRNVVYIRNEKIPMDFEVVLSQGTFAKEVGGFDDSDTSPMKRARQRLRDD